MRKLALIVAVAACPAVLVAQDAAEKTVEARQGYFKLLGANMAVLAGMAQGDMDYDAESAQAAADNMALLANYDASHLFAPGTSSDDVDGTRALPVIWEDIEGVTTKFSDFKAAAEAMQAVAGNGQSDMAGALGGLGGSCKACHSDYRAR